MGYRQHGDVILHEVESIPKGANKIAGKTFHKGLNHSHDLRGSFSLHKHGEDLFLKAGKGCEIFHDEHKALKIPAGVYRKGVVLEYDHMAEESRQVID